MDPGNRPRSKLRKSFHCKNKSSFVGSIVLTIFGIGMNKKKPIIQFHFPSPCSLKNRQLLKAFILSIFRKERQTVETVNIIFCDDKFLLTLNLQFLHRDYYTDILSFPLSAKEKPLIAEVYISTDRVKDNARNLESSFREELHRVIFHGILHFCGYNDNSNAELKKMRAAEDRYLNSYFRRKI
jgi:probable rRNA maturation factor